MEETLGIDRRADLHAFIARSRSVQRGMRWILFGAAALTALLLLGGAGSGVIWRLLAPAAMVSGVGFWITYGHIADFEKELRALDASARRRPAPRSPTIDRTCDPAPPSPPSPSPPSP